MMVHAEHKDTADYNYVTTSTGINLLHDSVMVDLGQHTTFIWLHLINTSFVLVTHIVVKSQSSSPVQ